MQESARIIADLGRRMAHILAKSAPKEGGTPAQTLLDHTLNVCRQMNQYYRLYRPIWPTADDVCLPRILAYGAFLHDFGKVHRDFQAMLQPGGPTFRNRHEVLSLAFLGWLEVPDQERTWLAASITFHHKGYGDLLAPNRAFYLGSRFELEGSPARSLIEGLALSDAELLKELLAQSSAVMEQCGWAEFKLYEIADGRELNLLALRRSLEDVERFAARFRLRQSRPGPKLKPNWHDIRAAIHVRGWLLNSDHVASFGPQELKQRARNAMEVERALCKQIRTYASHQELTARQDGSCVLIAPTGSGKTEAGLLWAARQAETGRSNGRVYFLLPYQTSMNAMQKRLVEAFAPEILGKPELWNSEVSLVHGRSLRTLYERLLDRDYSPEKASRNAQTQNDLARLQTAPLCVCSPFQVIRLLFAPKGTEGLLANFFESRLIFDEIHAYNIAVTAMSLAGVRFLVEHLGARVLLMSATLPRHLLQAVNGCLGPLPLIRPREDVMNRAPRHRLSLLPFDSQSVQARDLIQSRAERGSVPNNGQDSRGDPSRRGLAEPGL